MNQTLPLMHLYTECIHTAARMVTVTEIREKKLEATAGDARMAALGDEAAFSRLVLEYEGMLYRMCRSVLKSEADCADAVQETVITAWRRIGQLKNAGSFPAWAARICLNRCYRISRRPGGNQAEAGGPFNASPPDTRLDVMRAVSGLPRQLKLIVVFYYFEDWSVERIARATGLFQGTVKSRLHHARRLLAEALHDYKEGNRDDTR